MGVNVGLLTEYSRIYPDLNETLENLSIGIPQRLILQAGTTFLAKQTIDHTSTHWFDVANEWFRTENFSFKEDLKDRIGRFYSKEEASELSMLSPITSLKLLQLGFSKNENEPSKGEKQIEIDLFKIYLLLNESFTKLQTRSSEDIQLKYPDIYLGLLLLNMGFSTSDLINYVYSREFFCQTTKSMFLADFVKNQEALKIHIELFFKKFGVKSIEEYYSRVYGFLMPIAKKEKEGFIEFNIDKEEDKEFISKIAIQDYTEEDDVDFRLVRANPLVKTGKDKYRVTHPVFITDKLYKGIYFDLSKINEGLNKEEKIKGFRRFYTTNFSEKYLLYEVMGYCLKKRYIQYKGSEIEAKGIQGAPDYYIRNGKYIFLIENKDVFIKAEVKENPLFDELEAELKKKFLEEENGRGVGIKQIVKNIERVLSLQNKFDVNYKPNNAIIYPVLIVHDIVYDCPGLNHLFNKWFFKEIDLLKEKGLKIKNIRPLIILNIDTLIRSAEVLRIGKLSLSEFLEMYYQNLKPAKKVFKTEKEMKDVLTSVYLPSTKIIEDWLYNNRQSIPRDNKILEYAFNKMKS